MHAGMTERDGKVWMMEEHTFQMFCILSHVFIIIVVCLTFPSVPRETTTGTPKVSHNP